MGVVLTSHSTGSANLCVSRSVSSAIPCPCTVSLLLISLESVRHRRTSVPLLIHVRKRLSPVIISSAPTFSEVTRLWSSVCPLFMVSVPSSSHSRLTFQTDVVPVKVPTKNREVDVTGGIVGTRRRRVVESYKTVHVKFCSRTVEYLYLSHLLFSFIFYSVSEMGVPRIRGQEYFRLDDVMCVFSLRSLI